MSQVACGGCGAIAGVGAAYCSNCGARLVPMAAVTVPVGHDVSVPSRASAAPLPWERTISSRVAVWLLIGLLVLAATSGAGIAVWAASRASDPCVSAICVPSPVSAPLGDPDPFRSEAYGYSLDALGSCSRIQVDERTAAGVHWTVRMDKFAVSDWPLDLRGEPAAGRTADQIVAESAVERYAGSTHVYTIPMVEIGFHPGYGAVYDLYVGAGNADPVHARAIVMAAVRGDLAIVMESLGPWVSDANLGHPNPAQTLTPVCFSAILTSVTWPGEAVP